MNEINGLTLSVVALAFSLLALALAIWSWRR